MKVGVARISSPWHAVHRRIRLPGSGEKPFFPLCSSRSTGPTHPENSARLPSPRFVAFAPSGIIRTRSLHSGSSSLDFCSNSYLAAHSVALIVYDTVVLIGHLNQTMLNSTSMIESKNHRLLVCVFASLLLMPSRWHVRSESLSRPKTTSL